MAGNAKRAGEWAHTYFASGWVVGGGVLEGVDVEGLERLLRKRSRLLSKDLGPEAAVVASEAGAEASSGRV